MATLTEKELSALNDLLSGEEAEVKKFRQLACQVTDPALKQKFTDIANRHQAHFNTLFSQLN